MFGLIFGVATVTYAFSGMLSMDPFPSFNDRQQQRQPRRRAEHPWRAAWRARSGVIRCEASRQALEQLGFLPVKELELTAFAGNAVYLAQLADGDTRIVPMQGEPRTGFDQEEIVRIVSLPPKAR